MMRRLGVILGAAFFVAAFALIGSKRFTRVAVSGHSMEPGLRAGDWLIVDRRLLARSSGEVVVARDPRARGRLIVKRVCEVTPDDELVLTSDHPAHASDRIGPVAPVDVVGSVVFRYWPLSRTGRVA